ncbi:hypothetical protein F2Q68_00015439 [Brassica cretica]|uniref:Uncharacterized protein n=1 Tax=Brassica cretica TaxID=69181 RepID=A0A8S9HRB0_BRACR|nr:hypothetical protein F2Q68_00015439 [Brassica cretica]
MLMDHGCEITKSLAWDAREYEVNAVKVQKWARCQFSGYRYDIRTTNPVESINSALRSPREYPIIPLLDSIRKMLTRWSYNRKKKISKHNHPLTKDVQKKIERRTEKGKTFAVYPNLMKIPCRHAIKAGFRVGKQPHTLTDLMCTTEAWREAYHESINPIAVPEDAWDAEVQKWARCQFSGYRYDIRTTNPAESINSALRSPREYPIIPLLDSIREMLTRWFYNRKKKISKHNHPLTIDVEKKIERRTEKGKRFAVYPVSDEAWREAYHESINPIAVPEDAWSMPEDVVVVNVLPPESRKSVGLFKYASCGV